MDNLWPISGSGPGTGREAADRCQAIVLAAAGSTDPGANADTARMAGILSDHTGLPVVPSYLCAGTPTPPTRSPPCAPTASATSPYPATS